jgi:hypothetical protein
MAIYYKLTPLAIIFYDAIITRNHLKHSLRYKLKIVVNLIFN